MNPYAPIGYPGYMPAGVPPGYPGMRPGIIPTGMMPAGFMPHGMPPPGYPRMRPGIMPPGMPPRIPVPPHAASPASSTADAAAAPASASALNTKPPGERVCTIYVGKIPEGLDDEYISRLLEVRATLRSLDAR